MDKPHVRHAGCGGLVTVTEGRIVCTQCQKDVPNQMEWIHERLPFKSDKPSAYLDAVQP